MSLLNTLLAEESRALAGHDYLEYHRQRFDYVVKKCRELCPERRAEVLDIGRSHLSGMLLEVYGSVTTMGLPLSESEQFGHEAGLEASDGMSYAGHIVFDLNDAQRIEQIDTRDKFDLIVFAETIEHLYTAPELVLGLLATLLAPGGMIICQTPNASALPRRMMMLRGRNPYELLRINAGNRGHIREYTRDELVKIGRRAGLTTVSHEYRDYFGVQGGAAKKFAVKAVAALFPTLARGQTIVYKRAEDA
ncbi:MAG TPA: methyltransferase domain-containing protein [Terracidiphilus sp.]|jgi:SAM-dependent methyltransferase